MLPAGRLAAGFLLAAVALAPAPLSAQASGSAQAAGSGQAAEPRGEEPPPLVGDRPDFTESASVVTRLQLESGYTLEQVGSADVHTAGELLVRVPATPSLELRLGVPSWTRQPTPAGDGTTSGLTDASVGVKLGLRDPGPQGSGPAVAVLAGTSLPTGDVSSDDFVPAAVLAAGRDLSHRLSLGANLGVAAPEDAGDRYAELSGSVALGAALSPSVGGYLEVYGFAPTGGGPATSAIVDGGLTWLAGPHLQLDARVGAGVYGPAPDLLFGTGVVWRP